MLNIAICDDEVKELNRTKEMCSTYINLHSNYEFKVSCFLSPIEFKSHIMEQKRYDIVLLDIYMPYMTGIEFAYLLRESGYECQIIFLTTSLLHAVEAFSLHAAHYLVKPYTTKQFDDAITRAIAAIEKNDKTFVTLKTSLGIRKINYIDILYTESERHIQHMYLVDGNCLQIRMASTELFELLSKDKRFFKCGSTYILNLEQVNEVTTHYIMFENQDKIPMQRRQYKELLDRYTKYALEGI